MVIIVVLVVAAGAGILLTQHSQSKSTSTSVSASSTTSSAAPPFTVNYNQLIVGYQGGLYQLGISSTGTKQIAGVVVVLSTPTQAAMCTGFGGITLGFSNCTPGPNKGYTYTTTPGGSFPANSTFSGIDTGVGPGSAVVGQTYSVSISVTYTDGTTAMQTASVQAAAGGAGG